MELRIDNSILKNLICPISKKSLSQIGSSRISTSDDSHPYVYPIFNGIPIILDENKSLFNSSNITNGVDTTINTKLYKPSITNRIKKIILNISPTISTNIVSEKNYKTLEFLLNRTSGKKNILIIGGVTIGKGMENFINNSNYILVESDITLGPRTNIIFDAHQIPFENNTFDAVIIQAVMEHLTDPYLCSEEIHRVLKPEGIVYAETPFIQQVHMGAYDFTRFTDLGHRRLFRKFDQIERGIACGPGMALSWSYYYFMLSFFKNRLIRKCIWFFACFTSFYFKYFDYFLKNKSGAYDAASGFYFLGKKSDKVLTDKELLKEFRGQFNG